MKNKAYKNAVLSWVILIIIIIYYISELKKGPKKEKGRKILECFGHEELLNNGLQSESQNGSCEKET